MNINRFFHLLVVFAASLLWSGTVLAWCDSCIGECCTCPGEPQCLGAHESCDVACGLVPPTLNCPAGKVANSTSTRCVPIGSVDCGGDRYCKEGYQCGSDGGCVKADLVPCGKGKYCKAGMTCGSGDRCLKPGEVDCGNGTACRAGEQCVAGGGCIPAGTTPCGAGFCGGGARCAAGRCVPAY